MTYRIQFLKFLFAKKDHLYRVKAAERLKNLWVTSMVLILLSALIYGWMASLGIGSNLIASDIALLNPATYETSKLWFVIGRVLYGMLFAIVILLLPSLAFYLLTGIPYKKLIHMQQIVLFVLLLERLLWIPLITFTGLDWYTSPLSFGIIVSYLTEIDWFIYFFGAISLFQIWVMVFQFRFIKLLSSTTNRPMIISFIVLLHLIGWALAATIALGDAPMISRWFE